MRNTPQKSILIDTNQTLDSMLHQVLNIALVACGADGGSLMLVHNKRGILQIKARLGRPRVGRTQEPIYKIGDNCIAGWVARHKRPYLCPDVSKDKFFAASRSGKNFRSLLSVPIIHKGKALAVINADSSKKDFFSRAHQAKMEQVARQSSKPIADRISIVDALAELGVELTRLPKRGGVDSVLSRIAGLALRALGADVITLYQYSQEKDSFPVEGRGPTVAGELRNPGPMRRRVYPGGPGRVGACDLMHACPPGHRGGRGLRGYRQPGCRRRPDCPSDERSWPPWIRPCASARYNAAPRRAR